MADLACAPPDAIKGKHFAMSSLTSCTCAIDAPRSVALATSAHKWADTTKIKRNIAQSLRAHQKEKANNFYKASLLWEEGGGEEFFGLHCLCASLWARCFGQASSTCQSFTNHCIFGLCMRPPRNTHGDPNSQNMRCCDNLQQFRFSLQD